MRLVTGPALAAFDPVAGVRVVGAADHQVSGRPLLPGAPAQPGLVAVVLLDPHQAQDLHGVHLPQPARRPWAIERLQQRDAVPAHGDGERRTSRVPIRQPIIVRAPGIPLEPLLVHVGDQPLGSRSGQGLQGGPHGLGDQLQPVQCAGGRQYMGGIRALSAAHCHQVLLPQPGNHQLQPPGRLPVRGEPGTELTEHRRVEPWVFQLQAERVLPVHPGAYRVGGLPVGEALGELEHQHCHESGRGKRGPAADREQLGALDILEDLTECVPGPDRQRALRERRPGDSGCHRRNHITRPRPQRHHGSPHRLPASSTLPPSPQKMPQPLLPPGEFASRVSKGSAS